MSQYPDTSVLVTSLMPTDPAHADCDALLNRPQNFISSHDLNETFATLTGGRLGMKVDADIAAKMIRESIVPFVNFVELSVPEILQAQSSARKLGVRGGAIYDYMHWVAAQKINADALYTFNITDFLHLRRHGSPEVRRP